MSSTIDQQVDFDVESVGRAPSRASRALALLGTRYSPLELFAAAAAALLPISISPVVFSYTFTPKLAVLLLVAAAGLPLLVRLAVVGQSAWPARAALAFLAVALISGLTSGSVLVGLFGVYAWGTGWLFWCGVIGAWAIGRSLGPAGRDLVVSSLLVGAGANAAMTIVQQILQIRSPYVMGRSPVLGLYQPGQADGLMGNPVFLESILVGALAVALIRACRGSRSWVALGVLLSAGLELSGERLAVGLLAVIALAGVVLYRSRRAVVFAVAGLGSYALAYLATSRLEPHRLGESLTSNPRVALSKTLARALLHHPFLGFGPGGTIAASSHYASLSLARRLVDPTAFADAHDIVIEVAVTTGLLGLAAFGAFVLLALRHAKGVLLAFAVAAAAVELVEPLNVGVTPLIFLALGAAAASPVVTVPRVWKGFERAARTVLLGAALLASATMLYGDYLLNDAWLHYRYPEAVRGADILAVWSNPAATTALVAANRSVVEPDTSYWIAQVHRWWAAAVARQPTDTALYVDLAISDETLGQVHGALSSYRHALALDRYNVDALVGLGRLDAQLGHRAEAVDLFRAAVLVEPHAVAVLKALRAIETAR